MSTTKLIDNNRRSHAAKVLAKASKKNQEHAEETESLTQETQAPAESSNESDLSVLKEHYQVIREDIDKLRSDIVNGFEVLKSFVQSKANLSTLMKMRS